VTRSAAILLAVSALVLARPVAASGPLVVNGAGVPLAWKTDPVPFNPDRGRLGRLSNRAAVRLVTGNFAVWEAVPSSSIRFANAGALPVDARVGNYQKLLGVCDGLSPIIFDRDGRITDDLFGAGSSNEVLGFASPECGDTAAGTITEAVAVLNGRWIDGVATATNPELPVDDFAAVFVHEFGHFFNLDHSQIGRVEAFDDDPSNDDAVATMFPFLVNGAEAVTLALDDVASVSMLYPSPDFATTTGSIAGQILRASGEPFQGAYVIARNVADPRHLAVGYTSGARFVPRAPDGSPNPGGPPPAELRGEFELNGLPPGTYTVEIEAIDRRFSGGSGIGPLDPPVPLPGPPEFWNGADESSSSPPDDPTAATPIVVTAGTTVGGIDIVLNEAPASNDACDAPVVVDRVPFADTWNARTATTAADDPSQSCTSQGASKNLASLWYRFAAPQAGRFVVDTSGSTYDTVLSASTGACGGLAPVGCSDDTGTTVSSRLDLDLDAGNVVQLEVTAFHDTAPGTLQLNVHRGCIVGSGACDDGDPCTSGDVCDDGICSGPVAVCDDGNPCTQDLCDGAGGCSHSAIAGICDDGNPCTIDDTCESGGCTIGRRVDGDTLARMLRSRLPEECSGGQPTLEQAAARRLAFAARGLRRALRLDARRRTAAFAAVAQALRRARHVAERLRARGAEPCGVLLAGRVDVERAQLVCVRDDLARGSSE
jgi:hypothetical protein